MSFTLTFSVGGSRSILVMNKFGPDTFLPHWKVQTKIKGINSSVDDLYMYVVDVLVFLTRC